MVVNLIDLGGNLDLAFPHIHWKIVHVLAHVSAAVLGVLVVVVVVAVVVVAVVLWYCSWDWLSWVDTVWDDHVVKSKLSDPELEGFGEFRGERFASSLKNDALKVGETSGESSCSFSSLTCWLAMCQAPWMRQELPLRSMMRRAHETLHVQVVWDALYLSRFDPYILFLLSRLRILKYLLLCPIAFNPCQCLYLYLHSWILTWTASSVDIHLICIYSNLL